MAKGIDQGFRIFSIELEGRQRFGFLGLNPIQAGEMMIAVRAARRIAGAMGRTTSIVVNGNLVIEIDQIEGTIGSNS